MVVENKLISISGADFTSGTGLSTGSVAATISVLVGLSGNVYIPIRVDNTGAIENTT